MNEQFIDRFAFLQKGMDSIPESWRQRTIDYEELLRQAEKLSQIQL